MTARGIGVLAAVLGVLVLLLPSAAAASGGGHGPGYGAVFTMTNAADGNEIVAYARAPSGELSPAGTFSTGGLGSGASLADQGSLALTPDHRWLLAVDAGSDQISVFAVALRGEAPSLTLTDVASSDGVMPVSLTTFGNLVYVLDAGNATVAGNIAGFTLWNGHLRPLARSVEPLSSSAPTGAAEIAFDPSAFALVVSEKATNVLDLYPLAFGGQAGAPVVHPSVGTTPYGFAVAPSGAIVVSEATTGSLSSYRASAWGGWAVLSGAVPDFQGAPCWVAIPSSGAVAFTSNAHSDSISSYALHGLGTLTLRQEVAAGTDAAPTDLAFGGGDRFLYVYDAGAGEVQGYAVGAGGSLSGLTMVGGLPASDVGLVAL